MKSSLFLILTASIVLFSGCTSTGGGNNQQIGMVTGAILGGIAGAALGDGGDANVAAGVILGSMIGSAAGSQYDKRREELEAAEAQRQYEYQQEVVAQQKLESDIEALEQQKLKERLAQSTTDADVRAAEAEAVRLEEQLAVKKKAYEASIRRAERIQEAQERIAKAQKELRELEARENAAAR